jgi:hypothetical protein
VLPGTQQSFSFEDYTYGKNSLREWGPSLTISNVTFSGRFLVTAHYQELGPDAVLHSSEGGTPLALNFDYPVTAFGADYSSLIGHLFSSFTATLTLDSGEKFTFEASTNPDSTFFGFIAGEPIRSLTFSDGGIEPIGGYFFHEELIKNITMVIQVPEPGTAVLVGLGVLGMLVRRWVSAQVSRHP